MEAAIREIAAEAEDAFDDGWAAHPDDEEDGRLRCVYMGGAGVIQGLHELQERGLVELRRDYVPYLDQDYVPDWPEDDHVRSLSFGASGIRLVRQRIARSSENADRLAELIAANVHDEHRELMWGSAGTMLAAAELHRSTGEARWLELWQESAAWLEDECDPETGLWTQQIGGKAARFGSPRVSLPPSGTGA